MKTISGIVMKVTNTQIVLLTEEGTFKNIPRTKSSSDIPLIGQTFTYVEKGKGTFSLYKYASVAAVFVFLLVASFMFPFGGQAEEAFIITVDINPSIEIVTDEQLQIIRTKALNEDGKQILATIQTKDHLYDVMQQIVDQTVKQGFIHEHSLIATSVVPLEENDTTNILKLQQSIEASLEQNHQTSDVVVVQEKKDLYEEAKSLNMSINYLKEYKVLENMGIVTTPQEIENKSLSELKKMEKENRGNSDKKLKDKDEQKRNKHEENSNNNRSKKTDKIEDAQNNKTPGTGQGQKEQNSNKEKQAEQSNKGNEKNVDKKEFKEHIKNGQNNQGKKSQNHSQKKKVHKIKDTKNVSKEGKKE
ncbi:anti-sigma-I factor RsgI family protein [Halalkalibacter urbisdiaboli]|uniref:anti-sigma-I factor RsgI family protein n=1 Tax=Halalkalibacter urbisdiaboli TaxID=1960589 RepID=UPI000B439997|nr:hypothetical protein [Halalkalibacter urbisdiaboli]